MAEANTVQAKPDEGPTLDIGAVLKQLLADETALAALKEALADKEVVDADNQTREVEGDIQVCDSETEADQTAQEDAQEITHEKTEKIIKENSVQEDAQVPNPPAQEDSAEQLDVETDVSDVDWYLLNAALDFEIGDASLSSAARVKLEADAFCACN